MKKTFRGNIEDVSKEIKEWIKERKNEYDYLDVIVEVINEENND